MLERLVQVYACGHQDSQTRSRVDLAMDSELHLKLSYAFANRSCGSFEVWLRKQEADRNKELALGAAGLVGSQWEIAL